MVSKRIGTTWNLISYMCHWIPASRPPPILHPPSEQPPSLPHARSSLLSAGRCAGRMPPDPEERQRTTPACPSDARSHEWGEILKSRGNALFLETLVALRGTPQNPRKRYTAKCLWSSGADSKQPPSWCHQNFLQVLKSACARRETPIVETVSRRETLNHQRDDCTRFELTPLLLDLDQRLLKLTISHIFSTTTDTKSSESACYLRSTSPPLEKVRTVSGVYRRARDQDKVANYEEWGQEQFSSYDWRFWRMCKQTASAKFTTLRACTWWI